MRATLPTKRSQGKPMPKMKIAKHVPMPQTYSKHRKTHSKEDIEFVLFKVGLVLIVLGSLAISVMDLAGVKIQGRGNSTQGISIGGDATKW